MIRVYERINLGSAESCRAGSPRLAVVHACKSPCHQQAVGYRGNLPSTHPYYLALRKAHDLYLNIIDPPLPLFKLETFTSFLEFATVQYGSGAEILIHCNQGESRAPSLALLFLAKRLNAIPKSNFAEAKQAFSLLYSTFTPGLGIERFLSEQWGAIL